MACLPTTTKLTCVHSAVVPLALTLYLYGQQSKHLMPDKTLALWNKLLPVLYSLYSSKLSCMTCSLLCSVPDREFAVDAVRVAIQATLSCVHVNWSIVSANVMSAWAQDSCCAMTA